MTLSPDCRDGNHKKCYGDAGDVDADEPVDCGCNCHGGP